MSIKVQYDDDRGGYGRSTVDTAPDLTPRQETLLMFLGAGSTRMDPIRIMTGLFILRMETPDGWLSDDARYSFEPYNYGPYSSEIYSDLDWLVSAGYVQARDVAGQSWKYYSTTPKGDEAYEQVAARKNADLVAYVRKVREFVGSLSFRALLTKVYARYPDYAVNSVFQ